MNEVSKHSSGKHQSMISYTVGFILSLVFTLIPYYLVVNQVVIGQTLLLTILGFALIQLIVQVVFFLHLGRGPKPKWNLYFFIGTIGAILIVVLGSIIIINNLHSNMPATDQSKRLIDGEGIYQVGGELTGACRGKQINHKVKFLDGSVEPALTVASQCDTLSFTDEGGAEVEIMFGSIKDHTAYAGLDEVILKPKRSKTITLSETGTYQFHDDKRPEAIGTFAVYESK